VSIRTRITFRGHEDIQNFLDLLPREVAGENLREATLEAAEVVRAEAVRNALKHKRTGTLAEDIHKEIDPKSTDTRVTVLVGAGKKGWYGRLVETGHDVVVGGRKNAKRTTPGRVVGYAPPYPWLRPALDAKRAEFRQRWAEELRKRLERLAGRRLRRR